MNDSRVSAPACGRQHPLAERGSLFPEARGLGAKHQVREVDIPLVWRHVRALGHVAHVAQVTVIDDVPVDLLRDGIEFHALGFVDRIEQRREGMAEAEAAAAAVTDVVNAFEFFEQLRLVVEVVGLPVEGMARRSLETALALIGGC